MTYKEFFKGKKVAAVGLGPHFEMVADIKFLIKLGADLSLYDMRSEATCRHALADLIDAGLVQYAFGITSGVKARHVGMAPDPSAVDPDEASDPFAASPQLSQPASQDRDSAPNSVRDFTEDLAAADLIILSPDMPADASFLDKARAAGIRIEYPQTLFLKLAPPITLIGVLGACGKTTVAHMIHAILKKAFEEYEGQGIYYLDPETPSALSHLKKVRKGDLIVARITRSLISAYEESRVSPHIAVFTALPSGKVSAASTPPSATIFNMLEFQTYNNFIIGNDAVIDQIRENPVIEPKAKMLRTGPGILPPDWSLRSRGGHDRENAALALRTAELFKIPPETVRLVLESWKGLKGRLELIKKVSGIEFYNDTAASAPTATLAALRAISENKNVVLIMGGAMTGESYDELIENIPQYVSALILIPGSGTMAIRRHIFLKAEATDLKCHYAHGIEDAVRLAREKAGKGDRVLFSPAFDARGVEKSRMERGDVFVRAVRGL